MLGSDLAWIVWPPSPMAEAFFSAPPGGPHKDRAMTLYHTTFVFATFFTKKARERCTNTSAIGAAVTSGAYIIVIARKGIVVCPRCLVLAITFLDSKIFSYSLEPLFRGHRWQVVGWGLLIN